MGKGRVKVDLDRKKEGLNKRTPLLSTNHPRKRHGHDAGTTWGPWT
jgi:hypothetical protein